MKTVEFGNPDNLYAARIIRSIVLPYHMKQGIKKGSSRRTATKCKFKSGGWFGLRCLAFVRRNTIKSNAVICHARNVFGAVAMIQSIDVVHAGCARRMTNHTID